MHENITNVFVVMAREAILEFFFLKKHDIPDLVLKPNFNELSKRTHFTRYELKRLFARYCAICNARGRVDKFAMLRMPELAVCTLVEPAFEYECNIMREEFKAKQTINNPQTGNVESVVATCDVPSDPDARFGLDFDHFVEMLSKFSPKAKPLEKVKCLYSSSCIL